MKIQLVIILSVSVWSCRPGVHLPGVHLPGTQANNSVTIPESIDAIPPEGDPITAGVDPKEDAKATEPAIVGGAYLYCDTAAPEIGTPLTIMSVGCQVSQVTDLVWTSASKQVQVKSIADGAAMNIDVLQTISGSPYKLIFSADRSLQNSMGMEVDMKLPQGQVQMTSTLTHYHPKVAELRARKGLSMIASSGDPDATSGDYKTWSIWMPVRIPKSISSLDPRVGGKGSGQLPANVPKTVTLTFDETICNYARSTDQTMKPKNSTRTDQTEAYQFVSCTNKPNWIPGQLISSKAIRLNIAMEPGEPYPLTVGVVLTSSLE